MASIVHKPSIQLLGRRWKSLVFRSTSSAAVALAPSVINKNEELEVAVQSVKRAGQEVPPNIHHAKVTGLSSTPSTQSNKEINLVVESAIQRLLQEEEDVGSTNPNEGEIPFEIVDVPWRRDTVLLKRKIDGQEIQVLAEDVHEESLSLTVRLVKEDGRFLEFNGIQYDDNFFARSMLMKQADKETDLRYYNPSHYSYSEFNPMFGTVINRLAPWEDDHYEFMDNAIEKHLKPRGIDGSTFKWLHNYMLNKKRATRLTWLSSAKKFLEE